MSTERWTAETAELVADAIANADSLTGQIGPVTSVLAALADAGLLVQPGSEIQPPKWWSGKTPHRPDKPGGFARCVLDGEPWPCTRSSQPGSETDGAQ